MSFLRTSVTNSLSLKDAAPSCAQKINIRQIQYLLNKISEGLYSF